VSMKHLLITTIAAVVLVGCGESQPKPPNLSIHQAAKIGHLEVVKQHLAAGTDVNAKDKYGHTPLHEAADEGRSKAIPELLIANGADVNAKNEEGYTPLSYAAMHGFMEIAELLIAAGADVNAKTKRGMTQLDWAMSYPEIADLLRKHGAKTGEELKAEGK
jgi:ankyrin repeat protein